MPRLNQITSCLGFKEFLKWKLQNADICIIFKDKGIKFGTVITLKEGFNIPKVESDWFML